MAAPKDTLEDRAWTLLAQIMGDRGAWGGKEVDAVFSALSSAVEAERSRALQVVRDTAAPIAGLPETERNAAYLHACRDIENRLRARMEKDSG